MVSNLTSSPGLGVLPGLDGDLEYSKNRGDAFLRKLEIALASLGSGVISRSPRFLIPTLCCQAAGGDASRAAPVNEAWNYLFAAAHLLDAAEDGDLLPGWTFPLDQTINLATGMIFRSQQILAELEDRGFSTRLARDLRIRFNQSILRMCEGQDTELARPGSDLAAAWEAVDAKSGGFFALGCYAGARLETRSQRVLGEFDQFGRVLGRLFQIGDDLGDLWGNPQAHSDLLCKRFGALPQAYAEEVLPAPAKAALRERIAAIPSDPTAEADARRIILEAGAAVYLSLETRHLRILGRQALDRACGPSSARDGLLTILNEAGCDVKNRK